MKVKYLFVLMFLSFSALGVESKFEYKDFKSALQAKSFLRFDMESTKAGFITTDFTGVVKKFVVSYDLKAGIFSNLKISFNANNMTTDIDGRDEKMHDLCLNVEKTPMIIFKSSQTFKLGGEAEIVGEIKIRGKFRPLTVKVATEKNNNKISVSGTSSFSLKKMEIPDPSIWIASVNDKVELSFFLEM